ncbi:MAG: hypothetical protein ACP5FT_04070 [Acidilobus sp.]
MKCLTLIIKLSRRTTSRGQDVGVVAASLKGLVAGFIVKEALLAEIGARELTALRPEAPDRFLIADLRLEDAPDDLVEINGLAGIINGVTVTWRLATSEEWRQLEGFLRSAGIRPVLSLTKYELRSLGGSAVDILEKAIKSSGVNYVYLPEEAIDVLGRLVALAPGVNIMIEGVELGRGLCRGAKYEVIDQGILGVEDPIGSVKMTIYRQKRASEECAGVSSPGSS